MAIKDIIEGAVDVGKSAVTRGREVAERRLRGDKGSSGAPETVGAAKPGEAGGPKSATASTRAQAATASTRAKKAKPKAKAKAKAKAKPKPAKKRSTATRAAAKSGKEVSDAAKKA
jgi:hypothetical protein